jgi:hypothetical protein
MPPDPSPDSLEERIRVLEEAIARLGNPGRLSSSEAVTLRDYIEAKLAASEKALELASHTMDKRLDGMNEFRETLREQAARFVTRDEVALQMARMTDFASAERAAMKEQLAGLQTFRDQLEGKASASAVYISYGLALLGLVLSIVGLLLK